MCGIVGFLSSRINPEDRAVLGRMTDAIAHRGPDGDGVWIDDEAGVALGHRRLAVIDLSAAGRQPMASPSGRYVLVYNGEIYNYRDLRRELEEAGAAPSWRGHSDTEVMLAAFDRWGVADTLARLNGMFAFALWDRAGRVLTLARDRLGEKPLYYGMMGGFFLFGSELKALTLHPAFCKEVDRDALTAYLRYNCVPGPHSIWRGIAKLPPAHYVEVRERGRDVGEPVPYWSFREAAERGAADPLPDGPELVDSLETLLKDAVLRRMESDVPLGAFLSGGVDSSLIVSLMQAQSDRPVRTFTIGFEDEDYNEAVHAKAVANHIGTDHTELYVTAEDALACVPKLPAIWDEPFSDQSQVPTLLVSALTRRSVTVSLSGDGGDELFAGYNRYVTGARLWTSTSWVPIGARRAAAAALNRPAAMKLVERLMRLGPAKRRQLGLADRLPKVAQLLEAESLEAVYRRLVSRIEAPERVAIGGHEPPGLIDTGAPAFADYRQSMMYLDTLTYLPDDILTKVDRASMAVSLESRVPYLDHRVVEFAWRLPMSAKIRHGKGKHILRELLYRHVPRALIERPKMGFAPPIGEWLSGALRDWAEALLDESRLRRENYLDPGYVRRLWADHKSGRRPASNQLWDVLMFQSWLSVHLSDSPAAISGDPPRALLRA